MTVTLASYKQLVILTHTLPWKLFENTQNPMKMWIMLEEVCISGNDLTEQAYGQILRKGWTIFA